MFNKIAKRHVSSVIIIAMSLVLLLSGCASKTVTEEQYSGYLGKTYATMKDVEFSSGAVGKAWIAPVVYEDKFFNDYLENPKIMLDRVVWYPAPKPGPQVRSEVLMQLAKYYNEKLVDEINKTGATVVDKPGPGVIRMSPAFTGVEVAAEGMKAYEAIPVAAVFSAAKAAAGKRDRVVEVYLEVKATDSRSGELLAASIRKGIGTKKIKGKEEQMTLEQSRPILDQFISDFVGSLKLLKQRVKIGQ